MARKTLRVLAAAVAAQRVISGNSYNPAVSLLMVGKAADPKWKLQVSISDVDYDLADDSGKIKNFSTVDAAIKSIAVFAESGDGAYTVPVETGAGYASKVPANIYTDAEAKIVRLNRANVGQIAKHDALQGLLDGPMLGWNTGNAAQQAKHAETVAQVQALSADSAAIVAEVARLQAIVDSQP